MDLRMLLPVAAVGEATLTKLTLEWLLTCNKKKIYIVILIIKN